MVNDSSSFVDIIINVTVIDISLLSGRTSATTDRGLALGSYMAMFSIICRSIIGARVGSASSNNKLLRLAPNNGRRASQNDW